MPVKLTEDMVVARSKGSDLHNIRKLNCWGSELCDVSVVRKLPNVEVLSLSVNQLTGLADFQWCQNLQELYIRKNNIKDINELLYLRQLPKLKSLWLADNPCAQFSNYRLTVLRNLPHLQKLDNVAVEGEEVQQAMTSGLLLPLGQDRTASQDTRSSDGGGGEGSGSVSDYSPPASLRAQRQSQNGYSSPERECSSSVSHGRKTLYDEEDENRTSPTRPVQRQSPQAQSSVRRSPESTQYTSSAAQRASPQQYSSDERASTPMRRVSQPVRASPQSSGYYQSPPRRASHAGTPSGDYEPPSSQGSAGGEAYESRPQYAQEASSQAMSRQVPREQQPQYRSQEWGSDDPNDNYVRQQPQQQQPMQRPPASGVPPQRGYTRQQYAALVQQRQHYDSAYRRLDTQVEAASLRSGAEGARPYHARPKTRSGNVLSAVLCLIKELDYTGLEVAEMAIRCRMDELDD